HENQGGTAGPYAEKVARLAEALAAFEADLDDHMDNTLVITLSDFGRTAAENGSRGTDHGWANCLLAMGGPIARRAAQRRQPVLGRWPGLAPEQLNQGRDLLHTTDFRDVIAEVVRNHLGNPNLDAILPGYSRSPAGLIV
ncbi:MAG: DUF1501 domain-containing protein, partial [Verrucomicrobia bacterium]|nr:DUF1501 domain-containing protein [Verrucomicrobiota bacterium]